MPLFPLAPEDDVPENESMPVDRSEEPAAAPEMVDAEVVVMKDRDYAIAVVQEDGYPVAYLVAKDRINAGAGAVQVPRDVLDASPIAKDFGLAIADALPSVEHLLRLMYLNGVVSDDTVDKKAVQRALNLGLPTAGDLLAHL